MKGMCIIPFLCLIINLILCEELAVFGSHSAAVLDAYCTWKYKVTVLDALLYLEVQGDCTRCLMYLEVQGDCTRCTTVLGSTR